MADLSGGSLDLRALRAEARARLGTANVPPIRFTALYLAVGLILSLFAAALDRMLADSVGSLNFASLSFSFASVVVSLLSLVLMAGYESYCLAVGRGGEAPYEALFDGFPFAGKVILMMLLEGTLIFFGSMLFFVPGVILALAYALSMTNLCDHPERGAFDAMRSSRAQMRGHKGEYLLLLLSFWPYFVLLLLLMAADSLFLYALFPETMLGTLLHTLLVALLDGAIALYFMPWLSLTRIGVYRALTEEPDGSAPALPDGWDERY